MTASPRKFIRTYDDLDVFQRSMDAMEEVHKFAWNLPDFEKFDLASQMRRAAKSVPANIAEGYGKRRSAKEFRSYLTTALGSAMEMQVHLKIAQRLGYIAADMFQRLIEAYDVIARQLYRLREHWRKIDPLPPTSYLQEPAESDS